MPSSRCLRSLVILSALSGLLACGGGGVTGNCGPANCAGCCDSSGKCELGNQNSACGVNGAACAACPSGKLCQNNACGVPNGIDSGTASDAGNGNADAGTESDAGTEQDAGTVTDGGQETDGGNTSDAGSSDAGNTGDAGTTTDAGTDAGTIPDGGCLISGTAYASGVTNPTDQCELCDPQTSATSWSNVANGTTCDSPLYGYECNAGSCQYGCFISQQFYLNGAFNPANGCQACAAGTDPFNWTPADGTSCGTGKVCYSSSCQNGCYVANQGFYQPNEVNPSDSCQVCVPSQSTSALTSLTDGTSCGDGGYFCESGACDYGCIIGTTFYDAGTWDPTNACQACVPQTSTSTWTGVPFRPPEFVSTGSFTQPASVAAADLRGSGKQDLLLTNGGTSVALLPNDGGARFGAPVLYSGSGAGRRFFNAIAQDVNGDGKPDLISPDYGVGQVGIWLNQGGLFNAFSGYDAGVQTWAVAVADFNRDSRPDLAVVNLGDSEASVLYNQGAGSFSGPQVVDTGYVSAIAAGDLNGDGVPDLAIGTQNFFGGVDVLLSSDGGFVTTALPEGLNVNAVALGDFNQDGRLDIAATDTYQYAALVWLNQADGGFAPAQSYVTVAPTWLTAADVNADGWIDLVVTDSSGVGVFLNQGNGQFSGEVSFPTQDTSTSVAAADFNGDGKTDLAVSESPAGGDGGVEIFFGCK